MYQEKTSSLVSRKPEAPRRAVLFESGRPNFARVGARETLKIKTIVLLKTT
jgi:hypothetical protein